MQQELNVQPKDKRDYCVKELVETEGNYVDVLNMLRKHFIKQISVMKDADKKVLHRTLILVFVCSAHVHFFKECSAIMYST